MQSKQEIKHREDTHRLLRTISHEIRNPLHGILANTQALLDLLWNFERQAELSVATAPPAAATQVTADSGRASCLSGLPMTTMNENIGSVTYDTRKATVGVTEEAADNLHSDSVAAGGTAGGTAPSLLSCEGQAVRPAAPKRPTDNDDAVTEYSLAQDSVNFCGLSSSSSGRDIIPRVTGARSLRRSIAAQMQGAARNSKDIDNVLGPSGHWSELAKVKDMVEEIHECGLHQVSATSSWSNADVQGSPSERLLSKAVPKLTVDATTRRFGGATPCSPVWFLQAVFSEGLNFVVMYDMLSHASLRA
jgi:His Kinase A (phospho-acceptor) domain